MIEDFDDDTHYCIKCHATIIGLDNYVSHRKSKCGQNLHLSKSPLPSQLLPPDESFSLKADDFFSSLELQSSSKKITSTSGKTFNRILTRSKASAAIQASNAAKDSINQSKSGKNAWIGGHQLKELGSGDNQTKLIKAVDNLSRSAILKNDDPPAIKASYIESEEESDDYYYDGESESEDDAPPRSHTGGKWKPSGSPVQWTSEGRTWNVPPENFTGGKWKPKRASPPPTHTKGKWKPSSPNAHGKESFDVPRPSYTGGKWTPSKGLLKSEYTYSSDQRDDSFDVPKPSYTGGKWSASKVSTNNEQKDDYFDIPKPSYTGGKWTASKFKTKNEYEEREKDVKPISWNYGSVFSPPPPTHTKGKWNPSQVDAKATPPSSYTKGKWMPKQENKEEPIKNTYSISTADGSPFRKSNGRIQYWCGSCNRRLASKIIYERHLKSDLHLKRTQRDREFDDTTSTDLNTNQTKESNKTPVEYWSHAEQDNEDSMKKSGESGTRRIRRRIYVKCEVCRSRVHKQLMGKHLISHYHCRKSDITLPEARRMVLDNIYSIVLQSPYQCATCRFYCNTHEDFLRHWCCHEHKDQVSRYSGTFVCVFCKLETEDNDEMFKHLVSAEHNEVISVINRSVPIIIKHVRTTECQTCKQKFLLNIQLRKHCEKAGHPYSSTSSNRYQSKHRCEICNEIFRSKVAYQRHKRRSHKRRIYICSACDISFETLLEAKLHRRTSEHRCAVQTKKSKTDSGVVLEKKCQYCDDILANIILLKEHLKEKHPEHNHSCSHCGKSFTIPQQLSVHLRSKACTFQHTVINANKCDRCPFSTESMSELLFHKVLHSEPLLVYSDDVDKKHASQKYKCPICHKFFSKLSLRCHIRLHTKERPYACIKCNSSFIRKNNWVLHMKKCGDKINPTGKKKTPSSCNVNDRPYLCSTCGASFKKRSILQMHMTRHTGKLCKCPQEGCVFAARTQAELKIHFATHSDAKPFACSLCDYKGKTKQQLERHATVHENIRKYQCSICQFSSRLASHLKRHMRLHTGAKPFCCPHCKYRCNNLENLRKHVLSTNKHPGKCIYECKFCNGNFQSNFAKEFKVHLVTEHRDTFQTGSEAATYVAGIYEASDDSTFIDIRTDLRGKERDKETNIYKLKCHQDAVVTAITTMQTHATTSAELFTSSVNTSASGSVPVENKGQDELFPMYIVSKDVVCVENQADTWNMVGSYDVEESGTLVPFDSDDEKLFGEHFQ